MPAFACARGLSRLYPAHGAVIDDPYGKLDEYIAHRKLRERQILRALRGGSVHIRDVVATLYTETPVALHAMAANQVYAHLKKLRAEGKVDGTSLRGRWSLR